MASLYVPIYQIEIDGFTLRIKLQWRYFMEGKHIVTLQRVRSCNTIL